MAAQRRLPELNDGTLAFAGAYHGWGFHEDGCAAGVRRRGVAGRGVVQCAAVFQHGPQRVAGCDGTRLYEATVRTSHGADPRTRSPTAVYSWLVDLDALPPLPGWLRAVRPVPGARPPRRPGPHASGRTSTPSWPPRASTWAAGGC